MKKKGFTIVELIAVFLVLGIVLAITTPTIIDIIGYSYEKAYELNLISLRKAARNYMISEDIRLETDTQTVVTIPELNEAGVIKPIRDPRDKNECEGYVVVTSKDNTYRYYPYLKCGDSYISDNYGRFDNILPEITLLGDNFITIYKGEVYNDEGATALDDTDGDITSSIVIIGTVNPNKIGTYTITYTVSDSSGNEAIPVTRTINVVDVSAPVITLLGDNPITVTAGNSYIDSGAIATDDVDGNLTSDIQIISTVNPNVVGTYTVTYTVVDNAGNEGMAVRTVNVVDTIPPVITFSLNGSSDYVKSKSTIVTVTDAHEGVNPNSLMRIWNTSTTAPLENDFTVYFTNGETLNTPASVTGSYYLWVLAKDNAGNTTITSTNVFNLDNIKPIITMNGDSSITITQGTAYSDPGATATDNIDASVTVTVSGLVNTNMPGTYTITYNATDSAGNIAVPVQRTITVIAAQIALSYTGTTETYTVLATGTYELELWGAQGSSSGGKGGYVKAQVPLNKDDVLTINVGGTNGYNGGGSGAANGGGATTVLKNGIVLVIGAGGGGGSGGTAGGTGTGAGGASVGAGAGSPGTGGGGGGSSPSYTYYDSCLTGDPYTCVGGYKTCATSACGTKSCATAACGSKCCSACGYNTCEASACGYACCSSCGYNTCEASACGYACCSSCGSNCCSSCGYKCCSSCGYKCCSSCGYKTCTSCDKCGSSIWYCCPEGDCYTSGRTCYDGSQAVKVTKCKSCANSTCGYACCSSCGYKCCSSCGYACCSSCGYKCCSSCGYKSCATSACGYKCCSSCGYKSCATSECGYKCCSSCGYETCTHSDCGYYTCQDSACGWDSCLTTKNTCSGGYVTVTGYPGKGGSNVIGTDVTSISNQSGIRSGNGEASISFVLQ